MGALFQGDANWPQVGRPREIAKHVVGALETPADIQPKVAFGAAQELGRAPSP